jgi:hypothetical protein
VANYYESKDLERFSEIGKFKPELAKKFFDYYSAATGEDGALTERRLEIQGGGDGEAGHSH